MQQHVDLKDNLNQFIGLHDSVQESLNEEKASSDHTSWFEPKLAYIQMFQDEAEAWLRLISGKHSQPDTEGRGEDTVLVSSNTSRR